MTEQHTNYQFQQHQPQQQHQDHHTHQFKKIIETTITIIIHPEERVNGSSRMIMIEEKGKRKEIEVKIPAGYVGKEIESEGVRIQLKDKKEENQVFQMRGNDVVVEIKRDARFFHHPLGRGHQISLRDFQEPSNWRFEFTQDACYFEGQFIPPVYIYVFEKEFGSQPTSHSTRMTGGKEKMKFILRNVEADENQMKLRCPLFPLRPTMTISQFLHCNRGLWKKENKVFFCIEDDEFIDKKTRQKFGIKHVPDHEDPWGLVEKGGESKILIALENEQTSVNIGEVGFGVQPGEYKKVAENGIVFHLCSRVQVEQKTPRVIFKIPYSIYTEKPFFWTMYPAKTDSSTKQTLCFRTFFCQNQASQSSTRARCGKFVWEEELVGNAKQITYETWFKDLEF